MEEEHKTIKERLNAVEEELRYFATAGIGSPVFKLLGLVGIVGGAHYASKIMEMAQQIYIANPNSEDLANTALMGAFPALMIVGGATLGYISHWSKKEDTKRKNELENEARELRANPIYQSLEATLQHS